MNDKIKILQIPGTMDRGGVEAFLMNTFRNIDRDKFTFIFLCFSDKKFDFEDEIIALGGKIVRTPDVKEVGPLKHIKNIREIIAKERIDIIHAHTYFNSMFSMIAGKLSGVTVRIVHSHNTKSEASPGILKKAYFIISKYIINSHATNYFACGQDAGKALFYATNKFTIIDNGIILEDFYYNPITRKQLRSEFDIPEDSTVILHVGRFDIQKNHDFLIDIYEEYLKLNPNSRLFLVGDGILKTKIDKKVQTLGISKNVLFLGKRPDTHRLYNVADIFLFPSLHEGLPVTLIEAQANGLSCFISSEIDKTAKLVKNVWFYSLSNRPKQWAEELCKINTKRENSRETLEKSPYNMTRNIRSIENLYLNILTSKEKRS